MIHRHTCYDVILLPIDAKGPFKYYIIVYVGRVSMSNDRGKKRMTLGDGVLKISRHNDSLKAIYLPGAAPGDG